MNKQLARNTITPVKLAVVMVLSAAPTLALAATDINLTFGNTSVAGVNGTDFNFTCSTLSMPAGKEFRMCDPSGNLGGGLPTYKDTINGSEIWSFDSTTSQMTAVSNTNVTGGVSPGVAAYIDSSTIIGTGDRDGGPAIDQGAGFFSNTFGFLAPTVGSEVVTAGVPHVNDLGYSAASITMAADSATTGVIAIHFPVLEAQWAGTHFPLGSDGSIGITFDGSISNIVLNGAGAGFASFDYSISAEHTITAAEDPGGAGFSSWSPEWYMIGSGSAPNAKVTPTPSPTATPGVIGPTPGGPADGNFFDDGRITLAESVAAFGADSGADLASSNPNITITLQKLCNGGCFDYTVTGLAGTLNETVVVVLPMSSPIPANPVYRNYNATAGWHSFVEDANNVLESGLGTGAPVNCGAASYSAGLTQGNNCVRLTILNGGPNDKDGVLNTALVATGGVASVLTITSSVIDPQSINDAAGCALSSRPVSLADRADWLLLAAFLAALGIRRKIKTLQL